MARNSTRVCKSTGKNSSATRIRMAKVWYTVEHCWTRLDTAEQYQTRLNTLYCPDAVEHSRTLLNNWAPLNSRTLPDDVEYYWTLLDSVEHLGHGPDRIGHWILNSLWSRLFGKFWDNETLRNGNKLAPLLDTVERHGTRLNMARHGWTLWDWGNPCQGKHSKGKVRHKQYQNRVTIAA